MDEAAHTEHPRMLLHAVIRVAPFGQGLGFPAHYQGPILKDHLILQGMECTP